MTPRRVLLASGLAAVALGFPGPTPGGLLLAAVAVAALWPTVAHPASQAPALFLAITLVGWLLVGADAGGARLVGFVAAVAAVHNTAALAAVCPPRTPVEPAVVRRWVLRWAATAGAGLLVAVVAGVLPSSPLQAWTTVAAVVAIGAGVVALAAWAGRAGGREERPG